MTYQEWAEEYMESARILKERIDKLKKQSGNTPISELRELNFRINTMYMMYLDCTKTAELLMKRRGVAY